MAQKKVRLTSVERCKEGMEVAETNGETDCPGTVQLRNIRNIRAVREEFNLFKKSYRCK